ncbi:nucleotidyltransferase domain-containing protein [Sporolactobacillus terrae]|nr:nucleotidyltransferase domain-containing protein [Sporolactobacillus terrae]
MHLAKCCIASAFPSASYVSIGGSTARGTADQFSDLDLTIYHDSKKNCDQNIEFHNTIVQVQFSLMPRLEDVRRNPWAYRFLTEIKIVKDKNDLLGCVKRDAIKFINSSEGRKKMIHAVQTIVHDRIVAANRFFEAGRFYSSTNAAMGAWSEAAFLYLFLTEGNLSTSRVIPCIQENSNLYREFQTHASIRECRANTDFSSVLHRLREYLRAQEVKAVFDLDPLQERLVEQKNRRYMQLGDPFNLQWQMYGEALGLFFDLDNFVPFEYYHARLPEELQRELRGIGFIPLEKSHLDGLRILSKKMIAMCL